VPGRGLRARATVRQISRAGALLTPSPERLQKSPVNSWRLTGRPSRAGSWAQVRIIWIGNPCGGTRLPTMLPKRGFFCFPLAATTVTKHCNKRDAQMPRVYGRKQVSTGTVRYYADLRDIGFGQYALKPPGENKATEDPVQAQILMGRLIEDLSNTGVKRHTPGSLAAARAQLVEDNPGGVTEKWLNEVDRRLGRAGAFFGGERPLENVRAKDVREWTKDLQTKGLAAGTIRHHLHALSSVYRYAQELDLVPLGYNPVSGLYRKPSTSRDREESKKPDFLEIDTAARFLEAARKVERVPRNGLIPFTYALVGTFLLTGGRKSEVLGLLLEDIDFEAGLVRVRPNRWRPLKRGWSQRSIPLWPQLREILQGHLEHHPPKGDLLFPSPRGILRGKEEMIWDLRKLLKDVAAECGLQPIPTATVFRHTYATARLQTTDGGKQISLWTVAKELGHKTVARVEDTYGHPSHYRPRGEVVEYRV